MYWVLKTIRLHLRVAKKMVDHALQNGWDDSVGGFYDEGYYFKDKEGITITHDTKNWWAQAEGLNTLLMMADLFPKMNAITMTSSKSCGSIAIRT